LEQNQPNQPGMDPAKVRTIWDKVSRTKEALAHEDIQQSLKHIVGALTVFVGSKMLKNEREALTEEIDNLIYRLISDNSFKKTFGPVSFPSGRDYQTVIDFFEKLVKVGGEIPEAVMEEADTLLAQGKVKEAANKIKALITEYPLDLDLHLNVGQKLLEWEQYEDALQVFETLLDQDYNPVPVLNRLAMALKRLKRFGEAVDRYKQALQLAPRDEGLYYNLAVTLAQNRELASAKKVLEMALNLRPEFPEASQLLETIEEALDKNHGAKHD
jgi:tetratricopeptide (TPR) repeat protein